MQTSAFRSTQALDSSLPIRHYASWAIALATALAAAGCVADTGPAVDDAPTAHTEEGWDSQAGNPTHATHSYLTEYALDQLGGTYPELVTYRATIVDGANQELHELPVSDPEKEALRVAAGGTNWAADHPEVIWHYAQEAYAAGNKSKAYWYVGIVLHWVEDMGVPAHALHVIHQGTFAQRDNFELLGLQRWAPIFDLNRTNPGFAAPSDYVVWNGTWTANDFNQTFPGVTYQTNYFYSSWLWAPTKQANFVRWREARTAVAAKWALEAAVTHF